MNIFRSCALILSVALLSACGGGGASSDSEQPVVPSPPPEPPVPPPEPPVPPPEPPVPPPIIETVEAQRTEPYTGQALLGPIVDAKVELHPVTVLSAEPIYVTKTHASKNLSKAAVFGIPDDRVSDDLLYLITISGGQDIDADDDGVLDSTPKENKGSIHALLTGKQIKAGDFSISVVTEVAYQNMRYLLSTPGTTQESIIDSLAKVTQFLLEADITEDGQISGNDLIYWQPLLHQNALSHSYEKYKSIIDDIHEGREVLYNATPFVSFEIAHSDIGSIADVALKDNYALLAHAHHGLLIMDIENPKQPQEISKVFTADGKRRRDGEGISLSGDTALVATGIDFGDMPGLSIVDISNIESPIESYFVNAPYTDDYRKNCTIIEQDNICDIYKLEANSVSHFGNNAYVTYVLKNTFIKKKFDVGVEDSDTNVAGLQIVNIDEGRQTQFIALPDASDVEISDDGQTIYVAGNDDGLFVINSNENDSSKDAEILITIDESERAVGIALTESYLYLATGYKGLDVYTLPLKQNGNQITGLELQGSWAENVIVNNERAYVGVEGSVQVVDISTKGEPKFLATVSMRGSGTYGSALKDNILFTANHNSGLVVSNLKNINNDYEESYPSVLQTIPSSVSKLALKDNYLYASMYSNGTLATYPVTETGLLGVAKEINNDRANDMAIQGDRLFTVSAKSHITAFSLLTPENPTLLGTTTNVQDSQLTGLLTLAVNADYAYGSDDDGIYVYNISDAGAITKTYDVPVINSKDSQQQLHTLTVSGERLYGAGNHREFEIFDISTSPEQPVRINSDGNIGYDMLINGNIAYVAAGDEGLEIWDISKPESSTPIGSLQTTGTARGIFLVEDLLYIASFNSVSVADVSDPTLPKLIAAARTPGEPKQIIVKNNIVYVNDGSAGITLLPTLTLN